MLKKRQTLRFSCSTLTPAVQFCFNFPHKMKLSKILDNIPDVDKVLRTRSESKSRKAQKTHINATPSTSAAVNLDDEEESCEDRNDEELDYPISTNLGSNTCNLSQSKDLSVIANVSSQLIDVLGRIDMSNVYSTIPIPQFHANVFPGSNRFDVDSEGYVRVMYRPWMRQTIDQMNGMIDNFSVHSMIWALNGPQGIGKSHCLYLFTAMLKRDPKRYRVLYLPKCDVLRGLQPTLAGYRYEIARELFVAFYDNDDGVRGLLNAFNEGGLDLMMCLLKLDAFYSKSGIKVVLVFDQLNTLSRENVIERTTALNFLSSIHKYFPTFVSLSANNDVEVNGDVYYILEAEGYEIQDKEVRSVCKRYDPNISTEEAMEVLALAGRIPLEIALVFKQKGDNLPQKLENYVFNRSTEFSRSCTKYYAEQAEPLAAAEEMLKILMGGTGNYDQFDKKLIRKVRRQGYHPFEYIFTNQIAWNKVYEAVKVKLKGDFEKGLNLSASNVFRSNRTSGAKGMEVERYLIMSACSQRRFCFPRVQINLEQIIQITSYNFHFEFRSSFFAYPLLDRFEGIDFFIYDRKQKIFYLVKTVIDANGQSHRAKVEEFLSHPNSNLRLFLSCLKESIQKVDPEIKVVEVYLVKGPSSLQAKDSFNEITFSDMASFYPAFTGLY